MCLRWLGNHRIRPLNHFRFTLPFYDALRSGVLYPVGSRSNGGYGDIVSGLPQLSTTWHDASDNWWLVRATLVTF
jgi:hypothetical protein